MLVIKMLLINEFISIFIKENIGIVSPGIRRSLWLLVCCCKMKIVDRTRNLDSPVDFCFVVFLVSFDFAIYCSRHHSRKNIFLSANKLKNKD